MTDERRARTLTDEDFDELYRRLDVAWTKYLENLGYDVSTPKSRDEIRDDHKWVRSRRTGESRALTASFAALGMAALVGFGRLVWDLLTIGAQVTLKAKGGG